MVTRCRPLATLAFVLAAALPASAQDKTRDKTQDKTQDTAHDIRRLAATWQVPRDINVPKGIQAVTLVAVSRCERRLSVGTDALFDFDKASLRPNAEATLLAAAPGIKKFGGQPLRIEGHTDAKGGNADNMRLSEARATTVRDWMAKRDLVPAATPIKGCGRTMPAAPNTTVDGQDDPVGRQRNRRVELVFDTCK